MTRRRVGSLAELAPGSTRQIEVDAVAICLARVADGTVYAIDDTCTHEGESLATGELVDLEIECPAHLSRFDLRTGKVVAPPAISDTRVYAVSIEGDDIVLEL